jgi:hypothetical protein
MAVFSLVNTLVGNRFLAECACFLLREPARPVHSSMRFNVFLLFGEKAPNERVRPRSLLHPELLRLLYRTFGLERYSFEQLVAVLRLIDFAPCTFKQEANDD